MAGPQTGPNSTLRQAKVAYLTLLIVVLTQQSDNTCFHTWRRSPLWCITPTDYNIVYLATASGSKPVLISCEYVIASEYLSGPSSFAKTVVIPLNLSLLLANVQSRQFVNTTFGAGDPSISFAIHQPGTIKMCNESSKTISKTYRWYISRQCMSIFARRCQNSSRFPISLFIIQILFLSFPDVRYRFSPIRKNVCIEYNRFI